MPIYEYYCSDCHTIFNFFSHRVNTDKRPSCPRCKKRKLERQISMFSMTSGGGEGGEDAEGMDDLPIDEKKMERAMEALAGEAENISEDNPKQAAALMRKFSKMTGMEFGDGMQEALRRLESGEDPEAIEAEMGDALEGEEPVFVGDGVKKAKTKDSRRRGQPRRDPNLYDL